MIKMIFFDLDGTLLPMDQATFVNAYFKLLSQRLAERGYEPKSLINAVRVSTDCMVNNDGSKVNEEVFWNNFAKIFGEEARKDIVYFEKFYQEDFDKIQPYAGFNSQAGKTIKKLKEKGFKLALTTNPVFPAIATEKRAKWAGLDKNDFELITTYDNSHFCKPNLDYYREILIKFNINPDECLMVGNDIEEDMIAEQLGMKVFLMPECLIKRTDKDISHYPQGDFEDLLKYVENLNK